MYKNTGNNASTHHPSAAENAAIHYHLLHHQHQVHHPMMIPYSPSPSLLPFSANASASGGGDEDDDDFPRRDERFPQWSNQETRDFIEIGAEFDLGLTAAKRNSNLWEMVASRMRDKGYRRTPDQCKCKWKNLITRYKEQEASNVDNSRQCPFFDELHAVLTSTASRMQPPQLNTEDRSHEEEHDDGEEIEVEQHASKTRTAPEKKTSVRQKRQKIAEKDENDSNKNDSVLVGLQEMMRNFIAQQQRIDACWRESMEKHAEARESFEDEWRGKMEKLERERVAMEKVWRERDEQRREREESRAEKRDALLTMLLEKLIRDENR